MSVRRVALTRKMREAEDQLVADQLAREIEETRTYGTTDPTSNTPGSVYYKHTATTTDALSPGVTLEDVPGISSVTITPGSTSDLICLDMTATIETTASVGLFAARPER